MDINECKLRYSENISETWRKIFELQLLKLYLILKIGENTFLNLWQKTIDRQTVIFKSCLSDIPILIKYLCIVDILFPGRVEMVFFYPFFNL